MKCDCCSPTVSVVFAVFGFFLNVLALALNWFKLGNEGYPLFTDTKCQGSCGWLAGVRGCAILAGIFSAVAVIIAFAARFGKGNFYHLSIAYALTASFSIVTVALWSQHYAQVDGTKSGAGFAFEIIVMIFYIPMTFAACFQEKHRAKNAKKKPPAQSTTTDQEQGGVAMQQQQSQQMPPQSQHQQPPAYTHGAYIPQAEAAPAYDANGQQTSAPPPPAPANNDNPFAAAQI